MVYKPKSGALKGSKFYIYNADVLDRVAKVAGVTKQYLVRDAALAAYSLAEEAHAGTPDAIKGKYVIEVSRAKESGYLVEARVLIEPADRRPESRATVMVDKAGRVVRSQRYKHLKEVPSITAYVARELHISFEKAREKLRSQAVDMLVERLHSIAKQYGVKMSRAGRYHAPAGGIEVAGKYYKGGQFVPL